LLKMAQDDVERQWRVYANRAAMAGRADSPHIAPVAPPESDEATAVAKKGEEE
jgi:pyruvate-ferredoxin/flavodoxin oxidoreductase